MVLATIVTHPWMSDSIHRQFSSVSVPPWMVVVLYQDTNFGGRALRVILGPQNFSLCFGSWQFSWPIPSMQIAQGPNGASTPANVHVQLLALLNNARRQAGCRAAAGGPGCDLSIDSRLNAAAISHSMDQAINRRPMIYGSDGSTIGDRVNRAGYPPLRASQHVAVGPFWNTTAQTVFDEWMNSTAQRTNILGGWVHMGASSALGMGGRVYWTLVLALPM